MDPPETILLTGKCFGRRKALITEVYGAVNEGHTILILGKYLDIWVYRGRN